ncbi:hypothetical protein [Bradyrhizobium sp.]|uniref:hypothetical protein n=1 Tax=Bradyrhizobium sp. TaxID=376 RepID=UPI003C77452A
MLDFFRAHRAVGMAVPSYFIESTAPENVDDRAVVPTPLPPELEEVDPDAAVKQIAAALASGTAPNLVVMVHGFNNPEPAVLRMYAAAAQAIERDSAIRSRQGLVCVGYRWPSEPMGKPWRGSWDALPTLPTWILYFGAAVFLLSFPLFYLVSETRQWWFDQLHYIWNSGSVHIITLLGWTVAGLVLTAVLLRAIVYFRDNYRATNYGVPDLIQIIRAVDGEILKLRRERGEADRRDVQLSFIGHSMGGFVVTNTIRTLSDVFTVPVETLSDYGARARPGVTQDSPPLDEIGNVFRLKRFVLASPDIPAETLLSSRSNFLASALSRFEEAYLFSNEGDEVLRQISTLANYFVFPTKSRNHGFRLGNVEILSSNFGLIDVREDDFLRVLRIGNLTLQDLYAALEGASASRNPNASVPSPAQAPLPRVFTYFDCTDYVDREKPDQPARPLLTFAKWRKRNDPNAKLRWYSHLYLLFAYVAYGQKPNVHGGYFEGMLSQQLIYRLACLGYEDTVAAYGSERALSQICRQKQVRGLLSPLLALRRNLRSMANTPASQAPAPEIPGADL